MHHVHRILQRAQPHMQFSPVFSGVVRVLLAQCRFFNRGATSPHLELAYLLWVACLLL